MVTQVCRDECEVLEYGICHHELAIARGQPMLSHQLVLPDCNELPVVGSSQSYNCVRLGMPQVTHLLKPHSCYVDDGSDYRGTVSVTSSGITCKPWHLSFTEEFSHMELVGGHNYCRNPSGKEHEDQPWCYTNDAR